MTYRMFVNMIDRLTHHNIDGCDRDISVQGARITDIAVSESAAAYKN